MFRSRGLRLFIGGNCCARRGQYLLLCLSVEFFCAQACWAVWIELEVGVQVRKQCGVIFLAQMDNSQQAVNDGLGWGEFRSLLRGCECEFDAAARQFQFAQCKLAGPGMRIRRQSSTQQLFPWLIFAALQQKRAESDVRVSVFLLA